MRRRLIYLKQRRLWPSAAWGRSVECRAGGEKACRRQILSRWQNMSRNRFLSVPCLPATVVIAFGRSATVRLPGDRRLDPCLLLVNTKRRRIVSVEPFAIARYEKLRTRWSQGAAHSSSPRQWVFPKRSLVSASFGSLGLIGEREIIGQLRLA